MVFCSSGSPRISGILNFLGRIVVSSLSHFSYFSYVEHVHILNWVLHLISEERNSDVTSNMSCNFKNLIYVITCVGCNNFYIGETGTSLKARIRVHKQLIHVPEYQKLSSVIILMYADNNNFKCFHFINCFIKNFLYIYIQKDNFLSVRLIFFQRNWFIPN